MTETDWQTRYEQQRREDARELARGLRAAADFLDAHPEYAPYGELIFNVMVDDRAALREAIPVLGKPLEKGVSGSYYYLRRQFSRMVALDVNVRRDEVCRRVVVETVTVPEHVVPEHEEERVEWVCDEPILAGVSGDA